ncbi:MAG: hypothetical protein RLY86_24 [Pseudomonadota bacterium]|jgi:hypothetical protein
MLVELIAGSLGAVLALVLLVVLVIMAMALAVLAPAPAAGDCAGWSDGLLHEGGIKRSSEMRPWSAALGQVQRLRMLVVSGTAAVAAFGVAIAGYSARLDLQAQLAQARAAVQKGERQITDLQARQLGELEAVRRQEQTVCMDRLRQDVAQQATMTAQQSELSALRLDIIQRDLDQTRQQNADLADQLIALRSAAASCPMVDPALLTSPLPTIPAAPANPGDRPSGPGQR